MLLSTILIINLVDLVLARNFNCGPAKNECDWYICADSKYIDRKRKKDCFDTSFCTSSSYTSKHPRRKCRKDSSSSSSSSSSTSSTDCNRRDALYVIEEILACEAIEAKALVTLQGNAIESVVSTTLGGLATTLPRGIQEITDRLVVTITGILTAEEAELEEEVALIVNQANAAFTATALQATNENKLLAESQIHDLGRRSSSSIAQYVRNSHHGLTKVIANDFNNVTTAITSSYPEIIRLENDALIAALQGIEEETVTLILDAVTAANTQIVQLINDSLALATSTILAQVNNSLSELSLGLDLLFCETGHLITDIVKQVYDGKKVSVPRRISGRDLGPTTNGIPARCGALRR